MASELQVYIIILLAISLSFRNSNQFDLWSKKTTHVVLEVLKTMPNSLLNIVEKSFNFVHEF